MFTNLFKVLNFLLLLLLLCLTAYGYAYAYNTVGLSTSDLQSIKLFTIGDIENALNPTATANTSSVNPSAYYSPFLVATDDMMIAVVGVNRTEGENKNIDILTKHIEMNERWDEKAVADPNTNWKTQLAVQENAHLKSDYSIVKSLLATAKRNQVYLLLVNYTNSRDSKTPKLDLKLVVGTVKHEETPKKIEWKENPLAAVSLSENFKRMLEMQRRGSLLFRNSAFFTKKGKIVFVLVVDYFGQKMTALIHSKSKETELEIVYEEINGNCYPYYFPWEEKIVMVPANCAGDTNKKVMEFSTTGQQLGESETPLFKQHNFLKDKYGFVTVTVDAKDILLFMQPKKKIQMLTKKNFFCGFLTATVWVTLEPLTLILTTHTESLFFTQTTRCFCCFQRVNQMILIKMRLVKFYLSA